MHHKYILVLVIKLGLLICKKYCVHPLLQIILTSPVMNISLLIQQQEWR